MSGSVTLLHLTNALNFILMFVLAFGTGIYLTRRFHLDWRLYWIGAITFILSQLIHIPLNSILTSLFQEGILPVPPENWHGVFNAVILGLTAGLCEEGTRYAVYRWWAKEARNWRQALLFGAGHGGVEAVLIGILVFFTYINMVYLRDANLAEHVSPQRLPLIQQQLELYWSSTWYVSLLGALERAFTIPVHIALAVTVLQAVTRRQPLWLLLAISAHALFNASALLIAGKWGALAAEGVIGLMSVGAILWIFYLREEMPEERIEVEYIQPRSADDLHPLTEKEDDMAQVLKESRYSG